MARWFFAWNGIHGFLTYQYLKHEARDWNFMVFQVGFQWFWMSTPWISIRFVQFMRFRTSVWDENIDAGFMFTLENFHGKLCDGVRCRKWPAMMLGGSSSSRCHPLPAYAGAKWTHNFKLQRKNLVSKQFVAMFALQSFVSSRSQGCCKQCLCASFNPIKKKKMVKPKTKKVSVPGANRRFRMVPETLHPGLAAMPLDCMHLDFLSPPQKKVWSTSYITTKMFGELGTSTSTSTSTST